MLLCYSYAVFVLVLFHSLFVLNRLLKKIVDIQGGPKKSKPKTDDHNFVKS